MAADYATFGQFVLFKEILHDELGHLHRAGELGDGEWRRTVWLRIFDGAAVPAESLAALADTVNEIGRQVKAANVATGCELHVVDGVPALAWDHVPGQPLALVLRRVRDEGFPVPVDNALLVMEKLALALTAGLAFEHDGRTLIHGLVHPGLVVITNEGEAILAGLGLGDALLGGLDDPGFREAVAPYLAPETLAARTANRRTDVYSLGAILYHLLTGSPLPADPAQREAALDRATVAYDEEPVPDDIMELLRRSLASRPEERFSSAADFKKELDKLLYGGNYSPTTFNLALFMDRLFRADIEREERERLAERELDPAAFARPAEEAEEEAEAARGGRSGLWIAVAAALVLAAAAVVVLGPRLLSRPAIPPTPSPEEVAAKKAAEQQRIEAMVQEELQRMLAERQADVQRQLEERQKEIERLKAQLAQMERAAARGQMTEAQRRQRQQLAERLARAQQEQEAARARLQEQARAEAERAVQERLAQTPTAAPRRPSPAPAAAPPEPTATAVPPTATAVPPTPTAAPPPTTAPSPEAVRPGAFVPPEAVDTLPVILRKAPVEWPRVARNSRARGVVVLQATVDHRGRVTAVRVLRADHTGYGIPEAASEAVRKYRFRPATKGGVPVSTYASVAIPYDFRRRR